MQPREYKILAKPFCAMSQLLNKMKDFVKSVKYYLRYVHKGTPSEMKLQENLVASEWQFCCLFKKIHIHNSVPLVFILLFEA